ncbi:MAG: phosphoribosylanthranilate isomerase, partial [Zhongshania aliphaticivorans]
MGQACRLPLLLYVLLCFHLSFPCFVSYYTNFPKVKISHEFPMNNKINVKVCGMTRETDIEQVLSLGADYLGFIVYPKSSRALKLERAAELSAIVPSGKRVLVDVGTDPVDLERYKRAGFDHFQIHVNSSPERQILVEYVNIVGRDHLWLAPRL